MNRKAVVVKEMLVGGVMRNVQKRGHPVRINRNFDEAAVKLPAAEADV